MPSLVWKGHLTFGLVSIPVKLYRAARRERVRMHYVHREEQEEQAPATPIVPDFAAGASAQRSPTAAALPPITEAETLPGASPEPSAPISRVRQALVTSSEERLVSRGEVLRGYEVEPHHYVALDREELKGLQRRTSPTMEIVRPVKHLSAAYVQNVISVRNTQVQGVKLWRSAREST